MLLLHIFGFDGTTLAPNIFEDAHELLSYYPHGFIFLK